MPTVCHTFELLVSHCKILSAISLLNPDFGTAIHGLPLVSWGGVGREGLEKNQMGDYFCSHNMATFPTWHRPYLALYEVIPSSIMVVEF